MPTSRPWLYSTDGTPNGTRAIAFLGERKPSAVHHLGNLGTRIVLRLYFEGFHYFDNQLWSSDGTQSGTGLVVDFGPPKSASHADSILSRAGGILFDAISDPGIFTFRSDGTEVGTFPIVGAAGGEVGGSTSETVLGDGTALITAFYQEDYRLLRVEGDVATEIVPPPPASRPSYLDQLTRVGQDHAYFTGTEGEHGTELWRTDGTSAGTALVADLQPGPGDSFVRLLTDVFGAAWFLAQVEAYGAELWESRGTTATTIVHDLNLTYENSTWVDWIAPLSEARGSLAFEVEDRLYALEPADPEAHLLYDFVPGDVRERPLTRLGDELYFFDAEPDGRCGLWKSDGTPTGTVRIRATGSGSAWDPCPGQMVALNGRLYFGACTSATGCEIWTSDGTNAGTFRLADLEPGPRSLSPTAITVVRDRLYFAGCQIATGCEPWVTDGSAGGSHRLADIWPGARSGLASSLSAYDNAWQKFVESEGIVYFTADDGTGTELWAMPLEIFYDGFESGTTGRWSAGS